MLSPKTTVFSLSRKRKLYRRLHDWFYIYRHPTGDVAHCRELIFYSLFYALKNEVCFSCHQDNSLFSFYYRKGVSRCISPMYGKRIGNFNVLSLFNNLPSSPLNLISIQKAERRFERPFLDTEFLEKLCNL